MIWKAIASAAAGVAVWLLLRGRAESWLAGLAVAAIVMAVFRFLPPQPHTTLRRDAVIALMTLVTGALMGWAAGRWL